MSEDKKLIYCLVVLIIVLAIILLIRIKTTPQYDPKVYAEIYDEYEDIFGQDDDFQKIDESDTQNTIDSNFIRNENDKVIGKIIIPKIDIKCPIIKETTTEYLKIAPTKYCGPEANEVRKLSYSRS